MGLTGFNRVRREAALRTASPLPKKEEVVAEPVAPAVETVAEEVNSEPAAVKTHAVGKKKGATHGNTDKE